MNPSPGFEITSRNQAGIVNGGANRLRTSPPDVNPAYQTFVASAAPVMIPRRPPQPDHRARRPEPVRRPSSAPVAREVLTDALECHCCTRIVYDAWKGVRCLHIICTDCMLKTSRELVHCQLCIVMCGQDGHHNACVVCYGCELLCRCPERLGRAMHYQAASVLTKGRKPLEFYERVSRALHSVVAQNPNLQGNVGDVPITAHPRKTNLEREENPARDVEEKLRKLTTKQLKMEGRLRHLEAGFERLQRKVDDLASAPPAQALFQHSQEPQMFGGIFEGEFAGTRPDQQAVQREAAWQVGSQPYVNFNQQMSQAFYQSATNGISYERGRRLQPNDLEPLPLLGMITQAVEGGFPRDAGGPLRPAIVAVVSMRKSPDGGPLVNTSLRKDTEDDEGGAEESIIIREVSEQDDKEKDQQEPENNEKQKYRAEPKLEPGKSDTQKSPSPPLKGTGTIRPQKKDAETSVRMGNLVYELSRLYDKVEMLELDNARLRDDYINLQKANAKMRDVVRDLQSEQARFKELSLEQVLQPPLASQPLISAPQQAMSMQCGQGGYSVVGIQVANDAIAESSGSSESGSSSSRSTSDPSSTTKPMRGKSAGVNEEINIVVQSLPSGGLSLRNELTPGATPYFPQMPMPALAGTARFTPVVSQQKRTTSWPSYHVEEKASVSEHESYKKQIDDIMDWYNTCRRREAFLEATTFSYLKQALGKSCHFLDYGCPYQWDIPGCLKLNRGKSCLSDFRVFSGPIIDMDSRGLVRFVIDPLPSSLCVYVEILISAKPQRGNGYLLKIRDANSKKDLHCRRYDSEDMFGFRGVFSYPGTPCLGFFSIMIRINHKDLTPEFQNNDRLLIDMEKAPYH
ncbi:hypothetical protein HPB48_009458 [Haemaphysalis longicornis]|uniref:RING-type domain-containing protein n=1 Tax=Haemaphysalis longicornis TaxID=44386 RepID=A0A9J6GD47_HAELO|nr:hypothetical protein HPB48_009458 [Haemaphysalis longicornis]